MFLTFGTQLYILSCYVTATSTSTSIYYWRAVLSFHFTSGMQGKGQFQDIKCVDLFAETSIK